MKQVIISFGIIITCLLILFKLSRISILQGSSYLEYIIIAVGLVCLLAGLMLRNRSVTISEKNENIESQNIFIANEQAIKKIGLSDRELQILQLIDDGLSNQQIATKLFVSENTIKKHVSNLFFKMDVARRTEASRKAKDLGILK